MANSLQRGQSWSQIEHAVIDRDALPFSSVIALEQMSLQRRGGDSQFENYLNRRTIMRLKRYDKKRFDSVAEITRKSVYKPLVGEPFA